MAKLTFGFEVYCNTCGAELASCVDLEKSMRPIPAISIKPCKECLQQEYENGYQNGQTGTGLPSD